MELENCSGVPSRGRSLLQSWKIARGYHLEAGCSYGAETAAWGIIQRQAAPLELFSFSNGLGQKTDDVFFGRIIFINDDKSGCHKGIIPSGDLKTPLAPIIPKKQTDELLVYLVRSFSYRYLLQYPGLVMLHQ